MDENPNIAKTIKSMTKLKAEVKKLEKTIKKLEANPARTPQQEDRLQQSRADLVQKNSLIDARKAEITKFVEKKYKKSTDKEKQDTTKMLCDLETSDIDKEISVTEKNIQKRQRAYEELTHKKYEPTREDGEEQTQEEIDPHPVPLSRWQRFKNWIKQKVGRNKGEDERTNEVIDTRTQEEKEKEEKAEKEFRRKYQTDLKTGLEKKYGVVEAYLNKRASDILRDDDEDRDEDR